MSIEQIRATLSRAWALLQKRDDRRRVDPPRPGRPRDPGTAPTREEAAELAKPGFAEEALPWLDAVHRFALRLTRDPAAAEDLVQETYLKAFRSWDQFDRGTNCRSWLFTICRRTHLHGQEKASTRYEIAETDVTAGDRTGSSFMDQHALTSRTPEQFFDAVIDDELIEAVDRIPEDYREVLILSDLGDLTYPEISEVLDIPVGTVKSRLFRARRRVRDLLLQSTTWSQNNDDRPAPILESL